ncbi:hypothetical protein RhiirA1_534184 [Rhizophagus irregularis]|uniref:Uncharacterized protein n=2 Tax=Rhizophagus irregularis TaxID=588596 RepID=A0A2I1EG29_9GLOM|nr:hypothetical protein RirG_145510 [Rhizophagus irregularis DAOM 197198w]PKC68448.1 hypothetical protein RhiirA1_534184 [Rhizophagus irregularis]PKY21071.1 hypothetical protein RhiirB3_524757 [Rhizophagus irregularis]UZO21222.1 hypothetical protein OCT59_013621 [Rhizophagus irregularis]GBC45753.1 hypothetical protein GLOIN_2v1544040 [Rhizophagus irregularis DAOM 181602=DAOM 197198]
MLLQMIYDGNIHPDEWLRQFNTYCFLKKITEDNVKLAKMMIDSTIHVPKDVTSLTELVSALKVEVSFTVFKNTNKRKLQVLKYKSENIGGDTSKFIETFRKLCRDAEIDDLREQKEYFVETLPYVLKKKFLDKIDDIKSLSDIFLRFNNLLIEPTSNFFIKNGSIVALRHIATGKYLSTIENLRYETGSGSQMVFLGDTEPHHTSLWKIKFDKDYATIDTFVTLQQRFDKFLGIRYDYSNYYKRRENYYKSPSQNTEVSCNVIKENDNDNKWRFDTNDLNYQGCLKSNDIITLSIKNEIVKDRYEFLRGHDFQVNIGKEVYEEVVCHNKGIGVNDNWCIELIE